MRFKKFYTDPDSEVTVIFPELYFNGRSLDHARLSYRIMSYRFLSHVRDRVLVGESNEI